MAEWVWDEELHATVRLEDYERMARNRKKNRSQYNQEQYDRHVSKKNGATYITYTVKPEPEPEPAGCAMPAHIIRDMNMLLIKGRIAMAEYATEDAAT